MIFVSDYSREIKGFNAFIEKSKLVDILLVDRKFTWYKPNGMVRSRTERYLCQRNGSICGHTVNNKYVFDHCAVVLKDMYVDWGPKPFRCLDVWQKDGRFKELVNLK